MMFMCIEDTENESAERTGKNTHIYLACRRNLVLAQSGLLNLLLKSSKLKGAV